MNEVATRNDKRMTLRQVATTTGAAYSTIAAYAQKAGWTENGKKTLLDEKQVTVILEAMKQGHAGGPNNAAGTLQTSLEGIETTQSRAVRIAVLAQKQQEIERQIKAEMQAEIDELRNNLDAACQLLDYRTAGLETIQRIAEAGGLVMSDRDDVLDTYRRRRR
jgi:hypothetical protein